MSPFRLVPTSSLTELLGLIDPPPVDIDGFRHVFVNPNAAEILHRISGVVRAMIEASVPSVTAPVLTSAQADRIIGGLDPTDGGHDGIAAFIAGLTNQVAARPAWIEDVLRCRYPVCKSIHPSGWGWDIPRLNEVIAELEGTAK